MRAPRRKSEELRKFQDSGGSIPMTRKGVARLHKKLAGLEKELPAAIAEVERTAAMGDFSENAAYQDAKHQLRRLHASTASLIDQLNRVQIIEGSGAGVVGLGSTVTVRFDGKEKTFEIVGPAETNPGRDRISHLSPLGKALAGHKRGDTISLSVAGKETHYEILEIK